MNKLIIRLVINAAALYVASLLFSGIRVGEGPGVDVATLVVVAVIFGLVNALIKPIVELVTCPFYIITLGLFTFIVNAAMLELTDWLAGPRFTVDGFLTAVLGGIVISIVSTVFSIFVSDED